LLLVVRLHFVPGCTVEHVSLKLDHAHFGLCCMHCVQSVNKHNIYCAYFLLHFRLICRPSGRPGNVTLGQYMKPANAASHGSRPPPPPAFRAPPPLPQVHRHLPLLTVLSHPPPKGSLAVPLLTNPDKMPGTSPCLVAGCHRSQGHTQMPYFLEALFKHSLMCPHQAVMAAPK